MAFGGLIAASSTAIARADGVLSPYEEQLGDGIAVSMCDLLDTTGVTEDSMTVIVGIIVAKAGLSPSNSVDVVNYAVKNYCPEWWPSLVAFGKMHRGEKI